ncbi:MAG: hypothetical protein GY874_06555 [Desulfobacteraceae bacterium]|nr:hypothetical protein [Desulfobacteraceae bacterium]
MNYIRLKHKAIAKLAALWPVLARKLVASYTAIESDDIPWTQVQKPLNESKIALVTTAGVHHPDQAPFDMQDKNGDPGFRPLNGATIETNYEITHDYYDHKDARRDLNVVFPLTRLKEMQARGYIGQLADTHYGFMGHIDGPRIYTLVHDTAAEVAELLIKDRVDAVLLTPA